MTQPKPTQKPNNPRNNKTKTKTADTKNLPTAEIPDEKNAPVCHIHDKVGDWDVDKIRKDVCVPDSEYPLQEFEDKHYCLFHLPTKDKGGKDGVTKFEEIFNKRLEETDAECAEIEAEFPDDEVKQLAVKRERNISYNFSCVWFPSEVNLSARKFSSDIDFNSTTFSSLVNFNLSVFSSYSDFQSSIFLSSVDFKLSIFLSTVDFGSATFTSETNFVSVIFTAKTYFNEVEFSETHLTAFDKSHFQKDIFFDEAKFNNVVSFISTTLGEDSDVFFRDVFFAKYVGFQYCTVEGYLRFRDLHLCKESIFDFQEFAFEKASRVSFHTMRLEPNWFVNVDPRKFVFTNIDWGKTLDWRGERSFKEKLIFPSKCLASGFRQLYWKEDETQSQNIKGELKRLEERGITVQNKRLLEIACRQLAVNAEENNRYEEASKFRYMAMETKRLENKGVWRFLNLHWFYKWSSGYGESWARAAVVLFGILFLCGVFYNTPLAYFELTEKKEKMEYVIVRNDVEIPMPREYYKMNNFEGFIHSLNVAALQRPEPKPAAESHLTRAIVILETIFAPLQAALLALAIRRKFMR